MTAKTTGQPAGGVTMEAWNGVFQEFLADLAAVFPEDSTLAASSAAFPMYVRLQGAAAPMRAFLEAMEPHAALLAARDPALFERLEFPGGLDFARLWATPDVSDGTRDAIWQRLEMLTTLGRLVSGMSPAALTAVENVARSLAERVETDESSGAGSLGELVGSLVSSGEMQALAQTMMSDAGGMQGVMQAMMSDGSVQALAASMLGGLPGGLAGLAGAGGLPGGLAGLGLDPAALLGPQGANDPAALGAALQSAFEGTLAAMLAGGGGDLRMSEENDEECDADDETCPAPGGGTTARRRAPGRALAARRRVLARRQQQRGG